MFVYESKKATLLVYTRKPCTACYPDGLAHSVHFAVSRDGIHFQALHNNYGVLFAEGLIDEEDRIVPRGVKYPKVFALPEGGFGIAAQRVNEDGSREADPKKGEADTDEAKAAKEQKRAFENPGTLLLWKTEDFISFEGPALLTEEQMAESGLEKALENAEEGRFFVGEEETEGSAVAIDDKLCARIERRWNPVRNAQILLPDSITVSSEQELEKLQARAVYSDGSMALKKVRWNTEGIDFTKPGIHTVTGTVVSREFPFPLARGYGDPVIFPWEGKWYFLGTNDNLNDIGIYIREADTVEGLFADGIEEHLILGLDEERGFVQTFWAPEFHVIGGRLYILFAVSGKVWGPQCHLMRLKAGCPLTAAESWEEPVRVVRRDQSPLSEDGITLDMTYVWAGGRSYMVWSYRRNIGTPKDTGSMLLIAEADEEKPWQLAGDPVLLSRPLYGWENVSGTINNEGPHAFVKDGKVYLTYSGGAANGYTYVLGLLTAEENADLTDVSVWEKSRVPVLSFYSVEGEYGPGHNSFYVDEENNLMIAYHGETSLESDLRCDGIRRVHFDIHGEPVFDLSAKRDLDPALESVSVQVRVCPDLPFKKDFV